MKSRLFTVLAVAGVSLFLTGSALAQLTDRSTAPNAANEGIAKSFDDQIGAGRGDVNTPGSSLFIINRDPARSIRRGRQLFQRKFTRAQGQGPLAGDGAGDIQTNLAIGAGLGDSCATCHGRPRGSAGFGGDVVTRPDSRDAPHLFGLGLKEQLADEMTTALRAIRTEAISAAQRFRTNQTRTLTAKGVNYGTITAFPNGTVNTSGVRGVDPDLRVRPFFHHGGTISIREFAIGAWDDEMGMESVDPDTLEAAGGARVTTPAGMVLDGRLDRVQAPVARTSADDPDQDGVANEIPTSIVDHMEFYLLNYFKPAIGEGHPDIQPIPWGEAIDGQNQLVTLGCTSCHVPHLTIDRDRRSADVETRFDPARGNPFNRVFATASLRLVEQPPDGTGFPNVKRPAGQPFVVRNIYTDFKRHDLGPNFHERNFDGTIRRELLTTPLWGVGDTAPYGHDGRSPNLMDVILRHGGEATAARNAFVNAGLGTQRNVITFLRTLQLFPPDDTASNLQAAAPSTSGYPQFGHGSIRLVVLFNDPNDPE